jgi:hypothetical protein
MCGANRHASCALVPSQCRLLASRFPAGAGNLMMVEAGGQHIRGFRCGLDYAFIHGASAASARMRSVLSS